MTEKPKTSAADIVVPSPIRQEIIGSDGVQTEIFTAAANDLPKDAQTSIAGTNATFRRLRKLKSDCARIGSHQKVTVLIAACIEEGMDTRARIIGAMIQLGFNRNHVVAALSDCAGNNPVQHLWQCDLGGGYRLHPDGSL